jgi:glycerophosphoryl diester phosphodiesterase
MPALHSIGLLGALTLLAACASTLPLRNAPAVPRAPLPELLVIGHRGAPGHLPEHTLASYRLAIELGADCIEPDLVSTRDGALIARHEPNLRDTTDVADHAEFADRYRAEHRIDGRAEAGWFASDFSLAEIRTLRARQAIPELRFTGADGRLGIPTFGEVIGLLQTMSVEVGRTLCLYPELKHPAYHRELGLPLEEATVEVLARHGFEGERAPVFLQSFEPASLERLARMTELRLVQLLTGEGQSAQLTSPAGLDAVARYADGIGAWKPALLQPGAGGRARSTGLIEAAHERGLLVHAWTFRSEARWLPPGMSPTDELRLFFEAGVDGVFADFPGTAHAARQQFLWGRQPAP